MFKRLSLFLTLTLFALLVIPAAAQTPPPQVTAALNDLSTRLGISPALTVGDLDRWQWSQDIATDTSLGCTKAGETYTLGTFSYYQFLLTYEGVTYDYRVSADQTIIRLCNEEALTAIPAECLTPDYVEPRLRIGVRGRVEAGGVANNIRDIPGQSGVLVGEIPPSGEFTVLAGPSCAFGFVWWRVDYNGVQGWTVEGAEGDYWVEPVDLPPSETAQTRTAITPSNIGSVAEVPLTVGDLGALHVWSPAGDALAAAAGGGAVGVWIYDLTTEGAPRRLLTTDGAATRMIFNSSGTRLVIGQANGKATLWSLDTNTVQATFQSTATTTPVAITALAFSQGDALLAIGDAAGSIQLWEVSFVQVRAVFQAHTSPVAQVSFSPDGAFLTSTAEDGTLRLWSVSAVG